MGRWSPTVLPSGEPAPFWSGFQGELSRSLADSPAQAIAWDRNRMAKRELALREKEHADQEPLDYLAHNYRPTERSDYNEVPVRADANLGLPAMSVPGGLKDNAPTHMIAGRRWQYAPEKAQTEADALEAQHTLAAVAARRKAFQSVMGGGESDPIGVQDQGFVRSTDRTTDPGFTGHHFGEERTADPGFIGVHARMGAGAPTTSALERYYALTGSMPPRGALTKPTYLATEQGYMEIPPQGGAAEPVQYQGRTLMPRAPAGAQPKDYLAGDNNFYSTRYQFYLRPDKWGVAMSPDEADRRAKADVRRRRVQRRSMLLSEELGPDDNGDEGDE